MLEEELRKFRENYIDKGASLVRQAWTFVLGVLVLNKYASRYIIFDFSHWQSKPDGTTSVDWDALAKNPQVAGGYVKYGEVGLKGFSFEMITDDWMDSTFNSNMEGLDRNKLWKGVYTYLNCGWPLDRGWTDGGWKSCHDPAGKTEDRHANNLFQDLNIYLAVRKLKIGAGRVFDAAKVKGLSDLNYDKLVVDIEDVWLNTGKLVGDYWMMMAVSGFVDGIEWLMEHGYMKKREIWCYCSEWVLKSYGNYYLRTYLEKRKSICAGYFWNNDIRNTTVAELISKWLNSIPNNWTPLLFGIPMLYQVACCFTLPEVKNPNGGPSAVDVNVLNMTNEEFDALNPEWVARRGEVPPIEPPIDPPPAEKKYFATVRQSATSLKLRVASLTSATILDNDFRPAARIPLLAAPVTIGAITWVSMDWAGQPAYFAVKNGAAIYADVVEVTVG